MGPGVSHLWPQDDECAEGPPTALELQGVMECGNEGTTPG